jgi:hypothetical protein
MNTVKNKDSIYEVQKTTFTAMRTSIVDLNSQINM